MSSLDARNKRAMASGQAAWDNALPPEDDGEREYVDGQVGRLFNGLNADGVAWDDFALQAGEAVASADENNSLVAILLEVRSGNLVMAQSMARKFDDLLCNTAESCVRKAMERK